MNILRLYNEIPKGRRALAKTILEDIGGAS